MAKRPTTKAKAAALKALKAPADGLDTEARRAVADLKRAAGLAEEIFGSKDPMVVFGVFDRVFGFAEDEGDEDYDD